MRIKVKIRKRKKKTLTYVNKIVFYIIHFHTCLLVRVILFCNVFHMWQYSVNSVNIKCNLIYFVNRVSREGRRTMISFHRRIESKGDDKQSVRPEYRRIHFYLNSCLIIYINLFTLFLFVLLQNVCKYYLNKSENMNKNIV